MPETYYTPQEVAKALKVTPETVHKYLETGSLSGIKLGGAKNSAVRISKRSFDEFIAARQIGGAENA